MGNESVAVPARIGAMGVGGSAVPLAHHSASPERQADLIGGLGCGYNRSTFPPGRFFGGLAVASATVGAFAISAAHSRGCLLGDGAMLRKYSCGAPKRCFL